MTKGEILKMLKDEGFELLRNGGNHAIWTDGKVRVIVHLGSKVKHYHGHAIRQQIRRRRKEAGVG